MSYFGKSISTMLLLNANENSREGNGQQQQRHPNAKLTFCHEWLFQGRCPRPDRECSFAHGVNDLNMSRLSISTNKTKTIPCKYFGTNAGCPFGERCKYAHGEGDLRQQHQQQAISTEFLNAMMPGSSQNLASQPRQNEASGNENLAKMLAEICEGIRALSKQNSGGTNSGNDGGGQNGQQKKEEQGKGQPPAKNNQNEDNDEW